MIIYKPIFTTHWSIETFDSNNIRYIGNLRSKAQWKEKVGYYGLCFGSDELFFKSEESAIKWIRKEPVWDDEVFKDFKRVGEA